ncbi:MAG TPA: transglutaminase family protein [Bryobacteraceae bacterium]|jgi:transglutaminase-like putative cysteine protease|nr:transglutaminase family protein [Bryobacteraceae bacterium]
MIYQVSHKTIYRYRSPVSFGNHVACLSPRSLPHHACEWSELQIDPPPSNRHERIDYFGNRLTLFSISDPHSELKVEARSRVNVDSEFRKWGDASASWEETAASVPSDRSRSGLDAYQFAFESPRIRLNESFARYARLSFRTGRPFGEALLDLTARMHQEFRFDGNATNVRTTPDDVFRLKRGVCQDFAHVQIACLRSIGLPARYVSGYLRTYSAAGGAQLAGGDVSHAWVATYCANAGWLEVDPTNNIVPSEGHVTLAWGRDYGDISPLRGIILGGGREHSLEVRVHLQPAA